MSRDSDTIWRDAFFFFSGIIVSFLLQLFYDTIREEQFYQNMMSTSHWRVVLAITCGILFALMVYALRRHGLQ